MGMITRRRWAVAGVLAATLVVLAACSSNSGSGGAAGPTTTATTTTVSGAGAPEVEPTETGFQLPDGRLDEVKAAGLTFEKVEFATQPDGMPWPTQEWATGELPEGVSRDEVQGVVDRAFGELSTDGQTIDAILVVKDGELVVEEYNDWDPDARHMSWSVAKSITSSLVGILVGQGRLDIAEPIAAPEWSEPDDPRAEITLDHLLRMSSGLEWEESYSDPNSDVLATLGQDVDRAGYTASKPLADEPDTQWYYSTGTSNLIARSVAEQVGYGEDLTAWIDRELFEPLGIGTVEHSLDATGLISGGSWINLSPRDFARFGLLYARNGIWDGRRILPEGWVDYSRMPAARGAGMYGAQWWLDPERPTMFYASGFNGQSINVFPEDDLVIVVLSNTPESRDEEVRQALFDVFGV